LRLLRNNKKRERAVAEVTFCDSPFYILSGNEKKFEDLITKVKTS